MPPGPAKPQSKIPKLKQRVESDRASIASEQHSTSLPSSSRDVAKEYYKEMKKTQKPLKIDSKKQPEINLRKNSVSLSELELSARSKP